MLAWPFDTAEVLEKMLVLDERPKILLAALILMQRAVPLVYRKNVEAWLDGDEYTFLHSMTDQSMAPKANLNADEGPPGYTGLELNALFGFLVQAFSGECELR